LGAVALANPDHGFPEASEELKALASEIEGLKRGQKAIERDLHQVRVLLQAGPLAPPSEPENVVLSVQGAWAKGEKTARLTIIECMDYECPVCGRHFREVLPQLEAEYIRTGKVRCVLRDYPLDPIHPQALKAAEAACCAGDHGRYWEMHGTTCQSACGGGHEWPARDFGLAVRARLG